MAVFYMLHEFPANGKVINAPPYISCPCIKAITPPCILSCFVRREVPENINEAIVKKFSKPIPLFNCKARIFLILFRMGYINLLMSDIKVPAHDYGLLCILFQRLYKLKELLVEFKLEAKPCQPMLGVRKVSINKNKLFVFQRYYSSFLVIFRNSNAMNESYGFFFSLN